MLYSTINCYVICLPPLVFHVQACKPLSERYTMTLHNLIELEFYYIFYYKNSFLNIGAFIIFLQSITSEHVTDKFHTDSLDRFNVVFFMCNFSSIQFIYIYMYKCIFVNIL